jgi:hypothetical protein
MHIFLKSVTLFLAATVDIRYTYTGSENGFVTNTTRTVSVPGNTRILNFTYEPIPQ